MEFMLMAVLYLSIAFVTSFFFTGSAYKSLLKKNPIDSTGKDESKVLELEATRRKEYAKVAKKYGLWFSLFWCIVIPIEMLLQVGSWIGVTVNAISIAKYDRDFITAQQALKTKQILDEYEKQQSEQFDKELNS